MVQKNQILVATQSCRYVVGVTDCGTRSQIIVGIVSKFTQPHTIKKSKQTKLINNIRSKEIQINPMRSQGAPSNREANLLRRTLPSFPPMYVK